MNTGVKTPSSSTDRRKTNRKCLTYIVVGIILQTLIILVLILTIFRIRNLKLRLQSPTIENLRIVNSSTSPSFSMLLHAKITIKNTNFGHYKFQNGTLTILYRGTPVGEAVIGKAWTKVRTTKKVDITVAVKSENIGLGGDVSSGKITLTANAWFHGKVHLFKVIKKKKTAQMNCTMAVNTMTKVIEDLQCK